MWKCFLEGSVDSKQRPPANLHVSRNNGQHDDDVDDTEEEEDVDDGGDDDGGEGWHPDGGEGSTH